MESVIIIIMIMIIKGHKLLAIGLGDNFFGSDQMQNQKKENKSDYIKLKSSAWQRKPSR